MEKIQGDKDKDVRNVIVEPSISTVSLSPESNSLSTITNSTVPSVASIMSMYSTLPEDDQIKAYKQFATECFARISSLEGKKEHQKRNEAIDENCIPEKNKTLIHINGSEFNSDKNVTGNDGFGVNDQSNNDFHKDKRRNNNLGTNLVDDDENGYTHNDYVNDKMVDARSNSKTNDESVGKSTIFVNIQNVNDNVDNQNQRHYDINNPKSDVDNDNGHLHINDNHIVNDKADEMSLEENVTEDYNSNEIAIEKNNNSNGYDGDGFDNSNAEFSLTEGSVYNDIDNNNNNVCVNDEVIDDDNISINVNNTHKDDNINDMECLVSNEDDHNNSYNNNIQDNNDNASVDNEHRNISLNASFSPFCFRGILQELNIKPEEDKPFDWVGQFEGKILGAEQIYPAVRTISFWYDH